MKNTEFISRRKAFADEMFEDSFALFFSGAEKHKTRDQFFPFQVSKNFYYLTGLERQNFKLLILNTQEEFYDFLFIEEPSDYATKWLGARMTKEEASEISGINIERIFYLNQVDSFLSSRILLDSRITIASVPDILYLDLYHEYKMQKANAQVVFSKVIELYPQLQIMDSDPIIDELRRVKSEVEVDEVRKAINYTKKGIEAIMEASAPNKNERELESLFEYTIKNVGSEGTSFDTICASGKNATVLHYVDNNSNIEDNTLILNDLGALSHQYAADITRTFPANGKFTERQLEVYNVVLSVNKAIIEMVKPGLYLSDLNNKANDLLAEGLIQLGKIKEKSELGKYYYHSIGHLLGLDVHDVGTSKKQLVPGVIITVEPGLYLGDEGIGIRIEDDILVTKDGHENLSKDIIKEAKAIEEFMKK